MRFNPLALLIAPLLVPSFLLTAVRCGSGFALLAVAALCGLAVFAIGAPWLIVTYWLLLLLCVAVRWKSTIRRHGAALNAVLAKHTFSYLSKRDQMAVDERARDIIVRSGGHQTGFGTETSRYGWYALAMDELGIPAAIPDFKGWHFVQNPNIETHATDFWMKQVQQMCKNRYAINVQFTGRDHNNG